MKASTFTEIKNNFTFRTSNHFSYEKANDSSFRIFEQQCPIPFHDKAIEENGSKRSDCSSDGYHIFSLLSFLVSSFTIIINISNNSNLNNNNNNNNNNDNNNNNNNVNVNMMRKRKKRQGKFVK